MTPSQNVLLKLFGVSLSRSEHPIAFDECVDWKAVLKEAQTQTFAGQLYEVLEKHHEELSIPKGDILKWYANVVVIEKRNKLVNMVLAHLVKTLDDLQYPSLLLKGQGCAQFYPTPQYRSPGDIDLYVGTDNFDKVKQALDEASFVGSWAHEDVKHASFICKGVSIELHKHVDSLPGSKQNKAFQHAVKTALKESKSGFMVDDVFVRTLPLELNVVYVFIHMFRHFVSGGIRLRQVCDWLFICQKVTDMEKVKQYLQEFGFLSVWNDFAQMAIKYLNADNRILLGETPCENKKSEAILNCLLNNVGQESTTGIRICDVYSLFFVAFKLYPCFCMRYLLLLIKAHIKKYVFRSLE